MGIVFYSRGKEENVVMQRRKWIWYLLLGMNVTLLALLGMQYGKNQRIQGQIAGKVLRFHVLANSDTVEINLLPLTLPNRILYFAISYLLICIGIALSNRCGLPIIPTDLFPRELADITGAAYSNIKVSFDVICLAVTAGMTIFFLGHLDGLGIGTILAAFTMGKVIGVIGKWMDGRLRFVSVLTPKTAKPC